MNKWNEKDRERYDQLKKIVQLSGWDILTKHQKEEYNELFDKYSVYISSLGREVYKPSKNQKDVLKILLLAEIVDGKDYADIWATSFVLYVNLDEGEKKNPEPLENGKNNSLRGTWLDLRNWPIIGLFFDK